MSRELTVKCAAVVYSLDYMNSKRRTFILLSLQFLSWEQLFTEHHVIEKNLKNVKIFSKSIP